MMDVAIRKYRQAIYDLSCSEATLHAANEAYKLELDDKALSMMAGFSGGLMTEDLCGVISASIAVLSLIFNEGVAHQSPLLKEVVTHYMSQIEGLFGATKCKTLKQTHRDHTNNTCDPVIFMNATLLDKTIKAYRQ